MASLLPQAKLWILIYTMFHTVNAMITLFNVTVGDRMTINHPNKPIKNKLLQLTKQPPNNENHNWVNSWFSVKLNSKILIWLCLSDFSHFYSLTIVINLQITNIVRLQLMAGLLSSRDTWWLVPTCPVLLDLPAATYTTSGINCMKNNVSIHI